MCPVASAVSNRRTCNKDQRERRDIIDPEDRIIQNVTPKHRHCDRANQGDDSELANNSEPGCQARDNDIAALDDVWCVAHHITRPASTL
jgi:hypothetical protein